MVGLGINLPKLIFLDIKKGVGPHVVGAVRVGVVRVENLEVGQEDMLSVLLLSHRGILLCVFVFEVSEGKVALNW